MKSSFYLFLAALALTGVAPVMAAQSDVTSAETRFDPAIDDLPLMEGLTAMPDQDTLFTAQHGRIAESAAEGAVSAEDVYRFYRRTLPQLGWKSLSPHSYRRNGEKLSIDARADGSLTKVRFSIKPE